MRGLTADHATDGERTVNEFSPVEKHGLSNPCTGTDPTVAPENRRSGDRRSVPEAASRPDQHRAVDLAVAEFDSVGDPDTRLGLRLRDLEPDLTFESVEASLEQLADRTDVVPVGIHFVGVESLAGFEQGREYVHRPVGEAIGVIVAGQSAAAGSGEEVEDRGVEHVDAAVGQIGQCLGRLRLFLETLNPALGRQR